MQYNDGTRMHYDSKMGNYEITAQLFLWDNIAGLSVAALWWCNEAFWCHSRASWQHSLFDVTVQHCHGIVHHCDLKMEHCDGVLKHCNVTKYVVVVQQSIWMTQWDIVMLQCTNMLARCSVLWCLNRLWWHKITELSWLMQCYNVLVENSIGVHNGTL